MKSAVSTNEELRGLRAQVAAIMRTIKTPDSARQTHIADYESVSTPKKTYAQDWPIYEAANGQEKLAVYEIVCRAVDSLDIDQDYKGNGRPPVDFKDIIKSLCIQSYNCKSSWRIDSELRIAQRMGLVGNVYRRTTLLKYLQDPAVARALRQVYMLVAAPLSAVEEIFAADATGMSHSYGAKKWSQVRHTKEENVQKRTYSKLHVFTGCKTNVIAAAIVTRGSANDSPYLPDLLKEAAKHFDVKEVVADAGYLSKMNVKAVAKAGALAYIKPKKNVHFARFGPASPWSSMLAKWKHDQPEFFRHYHQRSNVEATFSALKRKYGDYCRARKPQSQENEILARIAVWNATVLAEALLSHKLSCPFMDS